jgi:hypothetical protein
MRISGCAKRPLHLGGLGVMDLQWLGMVLRLRWCWLVRADQSRSWASLPQPVDTKLSVLAITSTQVRVGDGQLALFWRDA